MVRDRVAQQAVKLVLEPIYTWIYALPKGELAREGILLRSGVRAGECARPDDPSYCNRLNRGPIIDSRRVSGPG